MRRVIQLLGNNHYADNVLLRNTLILEMLCSRFFYKYFNFIILQIKQAVFLFLFAIVNHIDEFHFVSVSTFESSYPVIEIILK